MLLFLLFGVKVSFCEDKEEINANHSKRTRRNYNSQLQIRGLFSSSIYGLCKVIIFGETCSLKKVKVYVIVRGRVEKRQSEYVDERQDSITSSSWAVLREVSGFNQVSATHLTCKNGRTRQCFRVWFNLYKLNSARAFIHLLFYLFPTTTPLINAESHGLCNR